MNKNDIVGWVVLAALIFLAFVGLAAMVESGPKTVTCTGNVYYASCTRS